MQRNCARADSAERRPCALAFVGEQFLAELTCTEVTGALSVMKGRRARGGARDRSTFGRSTWHPSSMSRDVSWRMGGEGTSVGFIGSDRHGPTGHSHPRRPRGRRGQTHGPRGRLRLGVQTHGLEIEDHASASQHSLGG